MKRRIAIGLAVLTLVGLVGFASYTRPAEHQLPNLRADLLQAIDRAGNGGQLDLSTVVGGDWDVATDFPGYMTYLDGPVPLKYIRDRIGFDWSPLSSFDREVLGKGDWTVPEGSDLLVFTKAHEVVAWDVLAVSGDPQIWFASGGDGFSFARDHAWFHVEDATSDLVVPGHAWRLRHLDDH